MGANWSGSPVGTFNQSATALAPAGGTNNNILIAAPAAGMAIYVQTITASFFGSAAGDRVDFHNGPIAGGLIFATAITQNANWSFPTSFPGGFRLNDATALEYSSTNGGLIRVDVTYTIGPTL